MLLIYIFLNDLKYYVNLFFVIALIGQITKPKMRGSTWVNYKQTNKKKKKTLQNPYFVFSVSMN
jgi:hypothetical protein